MHISWPSGSFLATSLLASLLLERVLRGVILRAGMKRGTIQDIRDPRPALLAKVLFMTLALIALAGWLTLSLAGRTELPARGSERPDELSKLLRDERGELASLQALLVVVVVYFWLQFLGIVNRIVLIITQTSSAPRPST